MDLSNAFLHGDLSEAVYMEQHPDFEMVKPWCVVYVNPIMVLRFPRNYEINVLMIFLLTTKILPIRNMTIVFILNMMGLI